MGIKIPYIPRESQRVEVCPICGCTERVPIKTKRHGDRNTTRCANFWQHSNQIKNTLNRNLKRLYGLSIEEYEKMVNERDGKCDICKIHYSELPRHKRQPGRLCVDHHHNTGAIRGLLCNPCNILVGFIEKVINPAPLIQTCLAYLKY